MAMTRHSQIFGITAFILCVLASQNVLAYTAGLTCPQPKAYPKFFLDNLWSGPQGYLGTTTMAGYVMVDATGNFDFVKAANISGTFLQYYSYSLGTYVSEMYIDIGGGVQVPVMNATFTLLDGDKNRYNRYGEYCMNADPASVMPGFVEGTPVNNKFFYNTYFNNTYGPDFGNVMESEYFIFDTQRVNSLNCLTSFTDSASIATFTCYRFQKVSDSVIIPGSTGNKRQIDNIDMVKIGNLMVPVSIIDPKYIHLFQ